MKLRPIGGIVLRQMYLMRTSPARILPMFAWVAIDIVLWGFLTRYLNTVSAAHVDFVPMLLGAVLMWDFFSRVMMGVTMVFFEDVWSRNFLNFFASPLSISEYLAGLVLSSIATSAVGLVVMILLAGAFGLSFLVYGTFLAPFLFTLFVFGIALGIFACALVLRLGPSAEWFIWPIPVLVSPFVGVFYPLSVLPAWMRAVSKILPPSYVFENMRAILGGKAGSPGQLVLALAIDVGYLALACWTFARVHRHAVRSGLIARYSAESVA